jgi:hypothetical protein
MRFKAQQKNWKHDWRGWYGWYQWFAWYPVRCDDVHQWVLWEKVWKYPKQLESSNNYRANPPEGEMQ